MGNPVIFPETSTIICFMALFVHSKTTLPCLESTIPRFSLCGEQLTPQGSGQVMLLSVPDSDCSPPDPSPGCEDPHQPPAPGSLQGEVVLAVRMPE